MHDILVEEYIKYILYVVIFDGSKFNLIISNIL